MIKKLTALLFVASLLASCTTPTYDDGTARDHSDMPWNTPQAWEGSMNVPGMGGYD